MMLLVLTVAVAVQAASEPKLTVSAAPRGYAITATEFSRDDFDAIVARQKTLAATRCGTLPVRWGRYGYDTVTRTIEGEASAYIQNYRQGFSCVDPATDPYKPAPKGWKATAEDDAAVLAAARRYFAAFDRGDAAAGLPLMDPIMEVTKTEWLALGSGFRASAGKGARTFAKVEWMLDDPDMAHPGIFAQIAFTSSYSGLATYCGTMVFYRESPARYLVTQQNQVLITREQVAKGQVSESGARSVCGQ